MEEIELRQYWQIIKRHIVLVISIPLIAVIISAVLSFFVIQPEYQADTTLLVNQAESSAQNGLDYGQIQANQALVNTYSAIIKSASVESDVIKQLGLSYTPSQLDKMISVSSPTQSQVIDVKVVGPSEAQAVNIANALATDFQHKAQTLMNVKNVQIVDKAVQQTNPSPVKPNKKLNVAIALILGLLVSVGLSFLMEYLDNRIRTEEDVQRLLGLPVLGVVTEYDTKL